MAGFYSAHVLGIFQSGEAATFRDSSGVERRAVNADVPGSNPGLGANIF